MAYLAHISEDGEREQTLDEHLKNTAELSRQFASKFKADTWGYCAGMVHDVGKASDEFQQRLHGGHKVDHSTAGMKLLLQKGGMYPLLAPCVAGHHSGMPDWGSGADCAGESGTICARKIKRIPECRDYSDKIKIPILDRPDITLIEKGGYSISFFIRMIFSCLVDADYLDTEKFMKNGQVNRESGIVSYSMLDSLLSYVKPWMKNTDNNTVNGRRTEILKASLERGREKPGIYSMTVPTGGGKTVSSLAFALQQALTNNQERIIYVIPYTSIIEQNAKIFRDILGQDKVLEHHSNVEYRDDDELNPMQLAAENWDKPVIVTTNVQFFESLYSNRPSKCRKLHNIVNSVIIFDEAQKLPTQYLIPCVRAMEELATNYGCTILLCTATQPSLQDFFHNESSIRIRESGQETNIQEICPRVNEQFQFFKRSNVENIGTIDEEELAEQISREEQALCICNSRRQAQKLYNLLTNKDTVSDTDVYHLSTLMYPAHRMKILNAVREKLRKGEKCILVATSLVEAGVDLDFQTVYREMAGIDSIVQAAGRCNREGKRPVQESNTYVFTFAEHKGIPYELSQPVSVTKNIASKYSDISSLDAIDEYFKQMHHIKGDMLDQKDIVNQFDAEGGTGHYPFKSVSEQFKLIEQDTRAILINKEEQVNELIARLKSGEHTRQLMRELQHYEVEIYQNDFDRLFAAGLLELLDENNEQIAILTDPVKNYSEKTGLKIDINFGDAIIW